MADIKGKRVSGDLENAGDFYWLSSGGEGVSLADGSPAPLKEFAALGFMCPCGCGREGCLHVYRKGEPKQESPGWEWDGNQDAPTLTPSIYRNKETFAANCGWHGFLTNGVWKSC